MRRRISGWTSRGRCSPLKKRLPVAENVFYLRVVDKGPVTECYVAKESPHGDMDAMDLRTFLKGACE